LEKLDEFEVSASTIVSAFGGVPMKLTLPVTAPDKSRW
jgi:hypothetical protein